MSFPDNKISQLFSLALFQQIANTQQISLIKYNNFVSMLISNEIPFDVCYTPGTRKDSPTIELTIYINPTASFVLSIELNYK